MKYIASSMQDPKLGTMEEESKENSYPQKNYHLT